MSENIPVRIGECLCPDAPHADGDFVYLRYPLDLRGGFRVKRRLLNLNQAAYADGETVPNPSETDMAELEISLAEAYLDEGIAAWNLTDENGNGRELTPENLREHLFSDYSRAEVAADKADDLYRPAVLDPLFQRALSSLPDTPVKPKTRATNGHGSKRPKRSRPSSTSTTRTDSTTTTSSGHAGASSS